MMATTTVYMHTQRLDSYSVTQHKKRFLGCDLNKQEWQSQHQDWQQDHDQIMKEMDLVALMDGLRENGWHSVELSRYTDNYHAIDIREWVHDYCSGAYNSFGRHWVFESSADAVLFRLRWA